MTTAVLDRFDAPATLQLLVASGALSTLKAKGFADFVVRIDDQESGLPHVRLFARKCQQNDELLLLEACVTETVIQPEEFRARGYDMACPIELATLYWLREEDPTASFAPDRPALPLQRHPGLGILRQAFQVIIAMARERGLDGVACVPKFFHDAVIFYRSRLFLFVDGREQGRFEALLRDSGSLALRTASMALLSGTVRDQAGAVVSWSPGLQVFPLSASLTAYFHSSCYSRAVQESLERWHFSV